MLRAMVRHRRSRIRGAEFRTDLSVNYRKTGLDGRELCQLAATDYLPPVDYWTAGVTMGIFSYPDVLDVWAMLDSGVFSQDSAKDSVSAGVTVSRIVQSRRMAGYADPEAIREAFASGQVVRLNQAEHWHPAIKALVLGLREDLRAEVRSTVFMTPTGSIFTDGHNEGKHRFILQLDGETRWAVSKDGQRCDASLRPGHALYVPPGYSQDGTASSDCGSLHVVIMIQQPTARDFAELALARFMKSPKVTEIAGTHQVMSVAEKVAWLRAELTDYLTSEDLTAMTDEAVKIRQRGGDA